MITKFWTVQNGLVGTAHTSREGKVVDFRPAKIQNPAEWNLDGIFTVIPTDGWTKSVQLKPTVTEIGQEISIDGESITIFYELRAEFTEIVFTFVVKKTKRTDLGKLRDHETAEAEKLVEKEKRAKEPAKRAEFEVWLTARMADPLMSGKVSIGALMRKPSRARWAIGHLVDGWFREFPLSENRFANRSSVFRQFQKLSGSEKWGAGGEFIQGCILAAAETAQAERKATWLSKASR